MFIIFMGLLSYTNFYRQRVLVVGGGGAVGLSAIQLAVAAGCHVSTTCGSESIERVLAVGAEQAVDYTTEVMLPLINSIFISPISDF
jgi:NADPH:quinone reductase-like Zn-dependent oxidoreductase